MTNNEFRDYAANERTFLAWVRTAIAVIALGFLVERFDLFVEIAARATGAEGPSLPARAFGGIVGLALILSGTAVIATSAVIFAKNRRAIASDQTVNRPGARSSILLALFLSAAGVVLAGYVAISLLAT